MFKTIANAWKMAELRKKILFTVMVILLYRIGTALPVPFLDASVLSSSLLSSQGSLFQYLNILSGGAIFYIMEKKIATIPACCRCGDGSAPEALLNEDYLCPKCAAALSRRNTFLALMNP